jgi:hypothetical protein
MDGRLTRRVVGALKVGVERPALGQTLDPRSRHGRRWTLETLLSGVVVGMVAGMRSLGDVERLTAELSAPVRKVLRLLRRIPDTTLRDVLVRIAPSSLQNRLTHQTRQAHRQKALQPSGLPFGVLGVDGKATCLESWGAGYAQKQESHDGHARGLLRTMTCVLLSALAPMCVHVAAVPPDTNEDGFFRRLLDQLLDRYASLDLFRLIVADAGSCSLANASYVRDKFLHYLFRLNDKQPTLLAEAVRLLGALPASQALAMTEEKVRGGIERRTLFATTEMAGFLDWSHLAVVLRVQRERHDATGQLEFTHERYFMASLRYDALQPQQWLDLVRRYWASVESGAHRCLDTAFAEDDNPWIVNDDQGALNLLILRRIAYNMLALFRGVTLRSEERRATPWRDLMRWLYNALISATAEQVASLRPRQVDAAAI